MQSYDIREINSKVISGTVEDYIANEEDVFDRNIEKIARVIAKDVKNNRFVLMAGPSCSGKTTSALKLESFLEDMGFDALTISLDNFFLSRDRAPRLPDGRPDFETVDALDLRRIRSFFNELDEKGKTAMPIFNFEMGRANDFEVEVSLNDNTVLLVEGLHALNDKITKGTKCQHFLKIYISLLCNVTYGDEPLLSKTQLRLMRRLVRDFKFRGSSAEYTLNLWHDVLKGDKKYVFPYYYTKHMEINSFFSYDAGVLKPHILKLYEGMDKTHPLAYEVKDLCLALEKVEAINENLIPPTAVTREFCGNSVYYL